MLLYMYTACLVFIFVWKALLKKHFVTQSSPIPNNKYCDKEERNGHKNHKTFISVQF